MAHRTGSIEEATITMEPKGIYLDVSLYLSPFSYEGTNFGYYDSLEMALNFTFPKAAIYAIPGSGSTK